MQNKQSMMSLYKNINNQGHHFLFVCISVVCCIFVQKSVYILIELTNNDINSNNSNVSVMFYYGMLGFNDHRKRVIIIND